MACLKDIQRRRLSQHTSVGIQTILRNLANCLLKCPMCTWSSELLSQNLEDNHGRPGHSLKSSRIAYYSGKIAGFLLNMLPISGCLKRRTNTFRITKNIMHFGECMD